MMTGIVEFSWNKYLQIFRIFFCFFFFCSSIWHFNCVLYSYYICFEIWFDKMFLFFFTFSKFFFHSLFGCIFCLLSHNINWWSPHNNFFFVFSILNNCFEIWNGTSFRSYVSKFGISINLEFILILCKFFGWLNAHKFHK